MRVLLRAAAARAAARAPPARGRRRPRPLRVRRFRSVRGRVAPWPREASLTRDARRPEPHLPRPRRDRRHGGRRARADPRAARRRRPPDTRFTAFVNREAAAAGDGPWGELLPAVTVPVHARRPRRSGCSASRRCCPCWRARAGVDLVHSLASTAPLWGRFRRVVTVHDLIYARFPDGARGPPRQGHARARAGGGAPLGPRDRRLAEHARRPRRAARHRPAAHRRRAARPRRGAARGAAVRARRARALRPRRAPRRC